VSSAAVDDWDLEAIETAATRDTDEHSAEFVQRVVREANRRGFDQAGRRVVLGDDALWIWNIADEHFPDATQIVDLYHAKEHLWQAPMRSSHCAVAS
jgi:transposase